MNGELVVREDRAVIVTPEQIDLIKRTIAPDATDAELKLFIYDNTRRGVNPLDKMIHFTKRGGKYTPVTGIDFMRTRAAETGEYAGSDDAVFGDGNPPEWARVTVHRFVQGQRCPFTATARWSEYYPGERQGVMWNKMPHTMLAKCAEALALRKGFPQQISGLYTNEEMAQASVEEPRTVTATPVYTPSIPAAKMGTVAPTDTITFDEPDDNAPLNDEAPEGFTRVTKVSKRTGSNSKGEYSQWFVATADGKEGSTFDGQLAVGAEAALASKAPVIATWEQKGKYTNLVGLVRA